MLKTQKWGQIETNEFQERFKAEELLEQKNKEQKAKMHNKKHSVLSEVSSTDILFTNGVQSASNNQLHRNASVPAFKKPLNQLRIGKSQQATTSRESGAQTGKSSKRMEKSQELFKISQKKGAPPHSERSFREKSAQSYRLGPQRVDLASKKEKRNNLWNPNASSASILSSNVLGFTGISLWSPSIGSIAQEDKRSLLIERFDQF